VIRRSPFATRCVGLRGFSAKIPQTVENDRRKTSKSRTRANVRRQTDRDNVKHLKSGQMFRFDDALLLDRRCRGGRGDPFTQILIDARVCRRWPPISGAGYYFPYFDNRRPEDAYSAFFFTGIWRQNLEHLFLRVSASPSFPF
jgi:hypothetical protein